MIMEDNVQNANVYEIFFDYVYGDEEYVPGNPHDSAQVAAASVESAIAKLREEEKGRLVEDEDKNITVKDIVIRDVKEKARIDYIA